MDLLESEGVERVIIEFEGVKLITTLMSFIVHGYEWSDGLDKQLILPLNKFRNKDLIKSIQTR